MARLPAAIMAALLLTACAAAPAPRHQPTAPTGAPATQTCASADPAAAADHEPLRITVATYNVLGGPPPPEWFPQIDPA
ncbi:MAG: hypothetical protein KIT69_21480, partial [Propionibacteriaceae bacterium]|nr:hypothetical protein [Propionibacteriaceae bacterium]